MPFYMIPLKRNERHTQLADIEVEASSEEEALLRFNAGELDPDDEWHDEWHGELFFEAADAWVLDQENPITWHDMSFHGG